MPQAHECRASQDKLTSPGPVFFKDIWLLMDTGDRTHDLPGLKTSFKAVTTGTITVEVLNGRVQRLK